MEVNDYFFIGLGRSLNFHHFYPSTSGIETYSLLGNPVARVRVQYIISSTKISNVTVLSIYGAQNTSMLMVNYGDTSFNLKVF